VTHISGMQNSDDSSFEYIFAFLRRMSYPNIGHALYAEINISSGQLFMRMLACHTGNKKLEVSFR